MSERPVIEFIDLKAQRQHIGKAMDEAILKVVHDGNYILGEQVQQFETGLAAFCGAKHAIGVANGTDALILVLEALGIGPGDAVICPSFTFAATAEVVAWMGATPVFAEHEGHLRRDPEMAQMAGLGWARVGRVRAAVRGSAWRKPCGPAQRICSGLADGKNQCVHGGLAGIRPRLRRGAGAHHPPFRPLALWPVARP